MMTKMIKNDFTFLIPFGFWVFLSTFRMSLAFTYIEPYYVVLSLLCVGIVCVRELFFLKTYSRWDVFWFILALFCTAISLRLAEGTMMYSCIFLFCARHTSLESSLKAVGVGTLCAFVLIVSASQMGLILDYVEQGKRIRHYLGFRYTLYAPAIYFNLVAIWVYLRKKKIHWIEILVLFLLGYGLYRFTDARLSFYFTVLLLILSFILKYWDPFVWLKWFMVASLVLSMGVSLGATVLYSSDSPVFEKINSILEGRLEYGQNSLEEYGVTIFGQEIHYAGNGLELDGTKNDRTQGDTYNYVDCFYLKYIEKYGLLFMGIVICAYTWVLYRWNLRKDTYILMIFSLFALHGMIDDLIFTFYYNGFLLILPALQTKSKNR